MCGWIFGLINSKLLSLTSFRRKRGEQWCVSGVKEDQLCRDGGRRGLCTVAGHVIPHTNTHQHTLTHLTQCWELNVDEWSLLDLIYNYTTHALLHVTQNYKKYICRELRAQGCFISFSFFFFEDRYAILHDFVAPHMIPLHTSNQTPCENYGSSLYLYCICLGNIICDIKYDVKYQETV